MAKQKRAQPRRPASATSPRMYGDGKPSESAVSNQPAAGTPSAVRASTVVPRTSTGASGAFARGGLSTITDYSYVKSDLRRLGLVAAAIIGALVILGIILP